MVLLSKKIQGYVGSPGLAFFFLLLPVQEVYNRYRLLWLCKGKKRRPEKMRERVSNYVHFQHFTAVSVRHKVSAIFEKREK